MNTLIQYSSRLVLSVFMLCLAFQIIAQHIRFQKTYGLDSFKQGVKNKEVFFYDVETLSDDGFATLGFFNDTLNRSEGFIARYDCLGNVLWTKTLGMSIAPTNTNAGIVEAENGDLVFSFNLGTGFFRASIVCGRINKDGQTIWMKRIGSNTEFGRDIVKTSDGGFIVVGSTGLYGTDNLADDIYIFKLDANGNMIWNKTLGNPNGTYDEAYAVKIDSRDQIIVTGRCIADATFQAFIIQMDPNGNPIKFKTYGYNNQRTNAFDLIVDNADNYLITGFTTILESDHTSSANDPFLIKVDSAMKTVFANVYEISVGDDISTIGEGLCQLDNGDYAIGISSLAFSTHNLNTPNSPNKNALYVIEPNGNLRKAFIYNRHGSQYTRVRKSSFGSVLLGGFSRAYTDKVHSRGLIIKTDNMFLSGCFDIDVTEEVSLYKPEWQIADFSYLIKSGTRSVDYLNYKDSSLAATTLCEEVPVLTPDFEGPDSICGGNVLFTDLSTGPGNKYWIVNQDTLREEGDLSYMFTVPGIHRVTLVLQYSCIVKSISKSIKVFPVVMDTIHINSCEGESYEFKGINYSKTGFYNFTLPGIGSACDSIITLDLKIESLQNVFVDLDTIYFCESFLFEGKIYTEPGIYKNVTGKRLESCQIESVNFTLIQNCNCLEFPNVFTPDNGDDINDEFKPVNSCDNTLVEYSMQIYNRWGIKVFETKDFIAGWNGRYNNEPAPMETYLYVSEYKIRYDGEITYPKSKKGTLTLIR